MDMPSAIRAVIARQDLPTADMTAVMHTIMSGKATPAQIGGFLVGLSMKGETVEEIAAAARVMRELAEPVDVHGEHLVDTCGTGGDSAGTFNISTACAFVAAAAGARVAKHGNRSVSSRSGSADVLEAAGVRIDLDAAQVARCIEEVGVGFMFAPRHHSAMRHAGAVRAELGVRTLFNVLGPLTNPARAPNQLIGVFSERWLRPLAEVLGQLGSRHVMVVHAEDGLDEISLGAPTRVAELREGGIRSYVIEPGQFGIAAADLEQIRVADAAQSLELIRAVVANAPGPALDIVRLNAGAAIYVAGLAADLEGGIARATQVIADGSAAARLEELVRFTQAL